MAINLIKLLTAESQANIKIFDSIDDLFTTIKNTNWTKDYIFWELKILELLGFNIDFDKFINFEIKENKKKYFFKSNGIKKYVPNFLIENNVEFIDQSSFINS